MVTRMSKMFVFTLRTSSVEQATQPYPRSELSLFDGLLCAN